MIASRGFVHARQSVQIVSVYVSAIRANRRPPGVRVAYRNPIEPLGKGFEPFAAFSRRPPPRVVARDEGDDWRELQSA